MVRSLFFIHLEHLNLWDVSDRPPSKLAKPPPDTILVIDEETVAYEYTQVIAYEASVLCARIIMTHETKTAAGDSFALGRGYSCHEVTQNGG